MRLIHHVVLYNSQKVGWGCLNSEVWSQSEVGVLFLKPVPCIGTCYFTKAPCWVANAYAQSMPYMLCVIPVCDAKQEEVSVFFACLDQITNVVVLLQKVFLMSHSDTR